MWLTVTNPNDFAHFPHILSISEAYLLFARYQRVLQLLLFKLLLCLSTCFATLCLDVFEKFRASMKCRHYGADSSDNLNPCQSLFSMTFNDSKLAIG